VIHKRTHAPLRAHPDAHIPHTCTLSLAQYVTPSLSTAFFSLSVTHVQCECVYIYTHAHMYTAHRLRPVCRLNSKKKGVFLGKFRINSGVLRMERGGWGAKAPPLAARPKLAGWGGSFSMVYGNNASRLGAGFISGCLETRWLGQKRGFYAPE